MEFIRNLLSKIVYGGGVLFDLAKWIIFAFIVIILANTLWVSVFVVDGPSMEPNYHDREFVLWQKNGTGIIYPRGKVVVLCYPGDPDKRKYVKRIIGLPGERVDIYQGKVYINKKQLSENYIPPGVSTDPEGTWIVKDNEYFVLGDNRPVSNDSRYFGPVETRFILGTSTAVILPRFMLAKDI
ncbi:MAG: signal peptidase I [Patescibacteria group bacterium]